MVEIKSLSVELRETSGKRRNRRLRESGKVPAVLYGHKMDNVLLSVIADEVAAVIRHGSRFVTLTGGVKERAFIKECQWDTWGKDILHIDFTRVSEHERVQLSIPLELRGEAPGVKEGGGLKQVMHSVEIECEPAYAPEKIDVNINQLGFNQVIHLRDLTPPVGVVFLADLGAVVVECSEVVEKPEGEVTSDLGAAEPELIGRKKVVAEEEE